jgi:hypothetical protein
MKSSRVLAAHVALPGLAVAAALVVLLAFTGAAAARGAPRFHRGHLPAIGEIRLVKEKGGLAEIAVPVHYTRALSGGPAGLETAEVTLRIAGKVKARRAVGATLTRTHRHTIVGTGVVVDKFRLGRKTSHWLLGRPRKERGRLVRVDVRHRIKTARGTRPLHEKDASLTMAASHRARPQGEEIMLTLSNETGAPIKTAAEPDLCMYDTGEEGSNLDAFTSGEEPLRPGGTIEAMIQGSANVFDEAKYEAGSGKGADEWFDWPGFVIGAIAEAAEFPLAPLIDAVDLADHCESQASTFQIVASTLSGEAGTLGAWVVTDETCSRGCVQSNMPNAFEALAVQNYEGGGYGPGEWAENSSDVLRALVGGWASPPAGGKIVQDQGLHWDRQELPEYEEEGFFWNPTFKAFELSVHEGSSPAGFSG